MSYKRYFSCMSEGAIDTINHAKFYIDQSRVFRIQKSHSWSSP